MYKRQGLSRTTVQNRIARLETQGVIRGYTVRVHDDYERSRIHAHILITLRPKQMPSVVKTLQAVSYTHLDVYKRQPMPCSRIHSSVEPVP